jgi:hypothetical protein
VRAKCAVSGARSGVHLEGAHEPLAVARLDALGRRGIDPREQPVQPRVAAALGVCHEPAAQAASAPGPGNSPRVSAR